MTITRDETKEVLDRMRRMETRITKYLESQGFDTGVKRPTWEGGKVSIPSLSCSIKEALSVVPTDWDKDDEITIVHKGDEVAHIYLP